MMPDDHDEQALEQAERSSPPDLMMICWGIKIQRSECKWLPGEPPVYQQSES
jgi:hypothetical protein